MLWEYILWATLVLFVSLYFALNFLSKCPKNVCVVVLGDFGRSPRMQYHCMSLAKEGFNVDIVAYSGSIPREEIVNNEKIQICYLAEPPPLFSKLPRLVNYILKTLWQSVTLGVTLLLLPKSAFHLVQNPPCIPTLAVVWLVCVIRSSLLFIDWHNYGYTILSLTLGTSHSLVRFSRWFEKTLGGLAARNICVTKAMQRDLLSNWNIRSEVLYDRPPDIFQLCHINTSHELFTKLAKDYPVFAGSSNDDTRFTETVNNDIQLKPSRPALIVSSTSWTEDEDFSVLLRALDDYDKEAEFSKSLPDLVVVITGKGPQKEYYQQELSHRSWSHIDVCLPWLESQDYPLLLGSADLGVCLHQSSSGLDLPMKVVDMFGCRLPVCAIHFSCLDELVKHDVNGLVFHDSTQLYSQIIELLENFPTSHEKLDRFRSNLIPFQQQRWHKNWTSVMLPLLKQS